jgi:hypothetical protein
MTCGTMIDQSARRVRRMRPFHFGQPGKMSPRNMVQPKSSRLFRIDFKDPEEDYVFVQKLRSNQGILVCRRKSHISLSVIRESYSETPLRMLSTLSRIHHPNVAEILDAYFFHDQLFVITEHLDISLLELEFKILPAEEWEIATIITEVKDARRSLATG